MDLISILEKTVSPGNTFFGRVSDFEKESGNKPTPNCVRWLGLRNGLAVYYYITHFVKFLVKNRG